MLRYAPAQIADEILSDNKAINARLYKHYADNFRKGIKQVYPDGNDASASLSNRLRANVSRFAAYKAYRATQTVRRAGTESLPPDMKKAKAALAQFQAWQDAEYNTAVARARTAKQWELYNEPNRLRLFPNIKWLPSTSAEQRPEHQAFYNRIWAKDDPFWAANTPGTLWNCKCGMQETADDVTDNRDIPTPEAPKGLKGNPGVTGEIFSDDASYFQFNSNVQAEKADRAIKELQRTVAKEKIATLLDKTANVSIFGDTREIVFDGTTKKHIANDIAEYREWLWQESIEDFPEMIENSTLVAYEDNTKRDKKPTTDRYYYFEHRVGENVFYFNVEENLAVSPDKHFFRLYSLTKRLRDGAVRI